MSQFYPTDEFLKAWRERDDAMRKAAGIKVIPSRPDDVMLSGLDERFKKIIKYGLADPPRETGEFYCETRECSQRGEVKQLPMRHCKSPECCPLSRPGTHYPLCESCGNAMRENVSAPNVIWTGPIGQRYRDKDKDGYHNPDGQIVYTRKTPDGKPRPVLLENWSDVKAHCKSEGLVDPRSLPRNLEVAEDGKGTLNTRGMPGTEL